VVFKGSGFYRTDSRTDSRADSRGDGRKAEKDSSDGAKTAGTTEKKVGSSGSSGSGSKAPAGSSAA
jgi:hypothetical protein